MKDTKVSIRAVQCKILHLFTKPSPISPCILIYRAIVRSTLSGGIFFYNIQLFSQWLNPFRSEGEIHNKCIDFLQAGGSKAVTMTILNPLNVLKTQLEASKSSSSLKEVFSRVRTKEGLVGLRGGWMATMVRDVPYSGLQFVIYKAFLNLNPSLAFNSSYVFAAAGASSAIATLISQPFDAVRVIQQNKERDSHLKIFELLSKKYSEGGIRNLYSGLIPRLMRKVLIGSFTWTLFEKFTDNQIHKNEKSKVIK